MCGGVRFKYDDRLEPALAEVYSPEQLKLAMFGVAGALAAQPADRDPGAPSCVQPRVLRRASAKAAEVVWRAGVDSALAGAPLPHDRSPWAAGRRTRSSPPRR